MTFEVTVEDTDGEYGICSVLKVFHFGRCVLEQTDGGEPEDNFFCRDWSWVEGAIRQAYELGYTDGHTDGKFQGHSDGYDQGFHNGFKR